MHSEPASPSVNVVPDREHFPTPIGEVTLKDRVPVPEPPVAARVIVSP